MLTFLRKIRKSLIKSSPAVALAKEGDSTRRYLLYALGEIALVVIGILIALQINNWNENNNDRKKEQEILLALKFSTELNRSELEANTERISHFIVTTDSILAAIDRKDSLTGELSENFNHALLTGFRVEQGMNLSGYKNLETAGLELIQSEPLRLAIIDLYGTHLPWLVGLSDSWGNYQKDISIELIRDGVITHEGAGYRPGNINRPGSLTFLRSVISLRRWQKYRGLRGLEEGIEKCRHVIELIDTVLKE